MRLPADKSIPALRESELNANSTRYEENLAAPSDEQLQVYWLAWAVVALLAGIFTLTVFLSLVTNRAARRQSFNVYLMYLMIPDFSFSLLCGMTCLMNALHGAYWSHAMCNLQQFYCIFGIGANCWLNAVIAHELLALLQDNQRRKKYRVPTRATVTCQAMVVYLYTAFLATWGLFPSGAADNFPYHAVQLRGLACIPVEVDRASSLFFWLVFLPLFGGIPIVYVLYTGIVIWKHHLLPPSGKRRLLVIYFGRIVVVFILMWGPYFLLNYILTVVMPTSVIFAGGFFSHFQGPLSAALTLLKPDVAVAFQRFLHGQCWKHDSDGDHPTDDHRPSMESGDGNRHHYWIFGNWSSSTVWRQSLRRMSVSVRSSSEQATALSNEGLWPDSDGNYSCVEHDGDHNDSKEEEKQDARDEEMEVRLGQEEALG